MVQRILLVPLWSLVLQLSLSQENLYQGCGTDPSRIFCIGSKKNAPSIKSGGCIDNKNCNLVIRIEKMSNNDYKWEWAFKSSKNGTMSALAIGKESIRITNKGSDIEAPDNKPFYGFKQDQGVQLMVTTCKSMKGACSNEQRIISESDHNLIKFGKTSDPKPYGDVNGTRFIGTSGKSKKVLSLNLSNSTNGNNEKDINLNLDTDRLVFTYKLWYYDGSKWNLVEKSRNMEPVVIFVPKVSLLWLWIILGAIGLLILLIVVVYCCCFKRNETHKRTRKGKKHKDHRHEDHKIQHKKQHHDKH